MEKTTDRSAILVISMGFLILYILWSWQWALYVSLAAGIIGILSVRLSLLIESAWMKLGNAIGYVVSNVLLSMVFFLVLTPIAMLFRVFNKDPLMLSEKHPSFFIDRQKKFNKNDFTKLH